MLALALASLSPAPLAQEEPTAAVDLFAGLRASLAREERLGIAAEKNALEEAWVEEAIRDEMERDGRASKLRWKPTYLHLGRWNKADRTQAITEGVYRVLVVQTLKIKKGGTKTMTYRPLGGDKSTQVTYQGAKVTMKLRIDTWDPVNERWFEGERWSSERDRTRPPGSVQISEAKNRLVTLDPAEPIVSLLASAMRSEARHALRASLTLPIERPGGWTSLLTPDEERAYWRRLAAIRFGEFFDRQHNDQPFPTRELAELALIRLETPDPKREFKLVRVHAAEFLRTLLIHYRDVAGAAWPHTMRIPTTEDAAGFRALFEAGLASLDSPEGVRFDRTRKRRSQHGVGQLRFDLFIHEDVMRDGLISSIPFAGVARSFVVVIDDRTAKRSSEIWHRALRKLDGAAIVERKNGKLVRTATLSANEVTSERIAEMLLARLRSD